MEFAKKLKSLMKRHRYSQTEVANRVDVSQSLVSLWVNGKSEPAMREAVKLAKLLGTDVEFLADDAQDVPAPSEFTEWERSIIELIRAMEIDRQEVWSRLVGPGGSQAKQPQLIGLTGQAALDAIAESLPADERLIDGDPPKPRSGSSRSKKA